MSIAPKRKEKKCRGWKREFYKLKAYMYIVYTNYYFFHHIFTSKLIKSAI